MREHNTYDGQGLRGPIWAGFGVLAANLLLGNRCGNNGCGGGILGGLLNNGCGCNDAAKDAIIAGLKSEKYTDQKSSETAERLLVNWLKPLSQEAADAKVREMGLKKDIERLEEVTDLKIQLAEQKAACCCEKNATAIECLKTVIGKVTEVSIPESAICKPVV